VPFPELNEWLLSGSANPALDDAHGRKADKRSFRL
jgi:hypothetical protein